MCPFQSRSVGLYPEKILPPFLIFPQGINRLILFTAILSHFSLSVKQVKLFSSVLLSPDFKFLAEHRKLYIQLSYMRVYI